MRSIVLCFFFFFNDTSTTEIYTLSLHDALPIWVVKGDRRCPPTSVARTWSGRALCSTAANTGSRTKLWKPYGVLLLGTRSEEHTSELQSQSNLVCRLLLEKKKKKTNIHKYRIEN